VALQYSSLRSSSFEPSSRQSMAGNSVTRKTMSTKSSKMGSAFRMVERQGACVGFPSPYDEGFRSPFSASASKLSHLFLLSASKMKSVLAQFSASSGTPTEDRKHLIANLESEFVQVGGKAILEDLRESQREKQSQEMEEMQSTSKIINQVKKLQETVTENATMLKGCQENTQMTAALLAAIEYFVDPTGKEMPDYKVEMGKTMHSKSQKLHDEANLQFEASKRRANESAAADADPKSRSRHDSRNRADKEKTNLGNSKAELAHGRRNRGGASLEQEGDNAVAETDDGMASLVM